MSNTYDEQKIVDVIDKVLDERDRMVRREIDASTCQTRDDFHRLHCQQGVYEKAYCGAIQEILQMIADARSGEVERLTHERDTMLKTMVEHDPTYPKAPWVVNKPWGYRLPYRWYPTESKARAAAYRALGLGPATTPNLDPKENE